MGTVSVDYDAIYNSAKDLNNAVKDWKEASITGDANSTPRVNKNLKSNFDLQEKALLLMQSDVTADKDHIIDIAAEFYEVEEELSN